MADKGREKEQFGEMRGSATVVNISFYWLCPQMTGTFLSEQTLIGTGINKA